MKEVHLMENKVLSCGISWKVFLNVALCFLCSRAHTIVAINFIQKAKNEAGQNMTKTSIVNLVDLAGR